MSSWATRAVRLDVSAYVIRGVMIDTGFRRLRHELLRAVRELNIRGAIVTHWHEDHAGNAAELSALGVPIAMREDTRAILRRPPDIQVYRRVVWGRPPALVSESPGLDAEGLETIHTPGHSTDHQVAWDQATRTLFSGDLWLGVRARVLHASEDPYRIIDSLRLVAALEPARMFDAHRGVVERPADALRAKIDWLGATLADIERRIHRGERDRQIVREALGGEEMAAVVSHGDYSRRNLVKAVRRRLSS